MATMSEDNQIGRRRTMSPDTTTNPILASLAWCPDDCDLDEDRKYVGAAPGDVAAQHAEWMHRQGDPQEKYNSRVRASHEGIVHDWDVCVYVEIGVSFHASRHAYPDSTQSKSRSSGEPFGIPRDRRSAKSAQGRQPDKHASRVFPVKPSVSTGTVQSERITGVSADTVHYSHEAYQPDVHLRCGRWTTPSWRPRAGLPDLVYQTDEGDLYTFERVELVTCEECRSAMAVTAAEPGAQL
jgi:hypothetical protein